ncbi:MAG: VCBS repeat-containing protein [Pyrinomonadaceae bacterium]
MRSRIKLNSWSGLAAAPLLLLAFTVIDQPFAPTSAQRPSPKLQQPTSSAVAVPTFAVALDFDGDGISDYATVRDSGVPLAFASPNGSRSAVAPASAAIKNPQVRDTSLGSMHRGHYFKLPGERFDPLAPRLDRPNTVAANQLQWLINTSGPSADLGILFGTLNDFPVPADYDGDLMTDLAVWTGGPVAIFRVLTSSSGFATEVDYTLGDGLSDPSIVGDYDGDGLADPAVFNSQAGQWTYLGGPMHAVPITVTPIGSFGGGFPVPGDFNGDRKYDFMSETRDGLNPAAGHFYQWNNDGTVNPTETVNFVFGNYNDVVIPGDYDGDGTTDVGLASVMVNPVAWRVRTSPSGTLLGPVSFGDPWADWTITGDYNGDGASEFTVWHDPGQFQSLLAPLYSAPTTDFSWGQSGDYPVAYFNAH